MKLLTQKKFINISFLVGLTVLIISGILAYRQIKQQLHANNWVIHTYKVIEATQQAGLSLSNMELMIRNDAISGRKLKIDAIDKEKQNSRIWLNTVKNLAKDNPQQQKRLNELKPVFKAKISYMDQLISIYQKQGRAAAIRLISTSISEDQTGQLTAIIAQISGEELKLLKIREATLNSDIKRTNNRLIVSGALSGLLFLFSLLLFNYHLNELGRLEIKRKEAEEKLQLSYQLLQQSDERYELAVKGSNTGLWNWEVGNDNVFYSIDFKKLLGFEESEFPNYLSSWENRLHPEDHDRVMMALEQNIQKNIPYNTEYRLKTKAGEYRWYQAVGQTIWDKKGNPIRISGSLVDVNERKKIENMKNEFVSVVSHELRTPLTSIQGSLSLVIGGAVGEVTPKIKDLLLIAKKNSARLIRLINDILDIQKMESGRMELQLKVIGIDKIVNEAIIFNEGYAENYNVKIKLSDISPGIMVLADSDRLLQVLTNLISNAIKFSPKEAEVVISIKKNQQESVRVEVIDRGVGIPEEFHPKIFQKFSQADSSLRRENSGTGLGLNIAKTIIEKLGGVLSFTSELNKGSTFYFDLPIWHQTGEISEAVKIPTILICEDDQETAVFLKTIFECSHVKPLVAYNVAEAKKILAENTIDALILDLILPDENGVSFIKEIR